MAALTPEQDAALGEVQQAHTDPAAFTGQGAAIEGAVVKAPRGAKAGKADKAGWRGEVTLKGEVFRLADEIGVMPLLIWASVSEMTTDDNRALAAIYSMLRDCIHAEHWARFQMHAITTKAKTDELLDVITTALEALTATPTEPPSAAPAGQRPTSAALKATSSSGRARKSRS